MIPGVHIYIDGVIKDGDKVVRKVRRQKGHSFVKQFSQYLLASFGYCLVSIKDITAASKTKLVSNPRITINVNGSSGNASHGLVVGSSAAGVAITDYYVNTLIQHGITAGKLSYSANIIGAPTSDATSNYFIITRVFTNGSGGNVSVNELGLCGYDGSYYYCFARDVLASTIVLANGQNLTLNYTIKATI